MDFVSYTKRFPLRNAAVAVALTLGLWGLPWLVWPSGPRMGTARAQKAALKVQYLSDVRGLDGSVWSPVLMQYPPKSGPGTKDDLPGGIQGAAMLVGPPVPGEATLSAPPEPAAVAGRLPETNPRRDVFRLEPVEEPAYAGSVHGAGAGWVVEPMDGLAGRNFSAPELEKIAAPEGGAGWISACAHVELGADGSVEHVFLESLSGFTNVDQAVVRALRTGSGDPAARAAGGRVRMSRRIEEK